ncbi:MAG: methionine synthase [Muribaculaceae bacterium]|nr:methionine synthase [Muribaculaceae bacterium]
MITTPHIERINNLKETLSQRILILDGAMGTMIQKENLQEEDFHIPGHAPSSDRLLAGCNDVLVLSRPDVIKKIHTEYIAAGADIIETCSFNANSISLSEYALVDKVADINEAAARIAREAADAAGRHVWVAGSVGPTSKSLTMAVNLNDSTDFDIMESAYHEQISALLKGGIDLLLVETIFDTLNAKAAIHAALRSMDETGVIVPIITSVTLTESGRTLSGQGLEAFVISVSHAAPLAVSLNCGFGAEALVPYIESLQEVPCAIALYPNAGLPDKLGRYTETPEMMVEALRPLFRSQSINIVGGCCGTTPAHIAAIADEAAKYSPRPIPTQEHLTRLAGLDPLIISPESNLINIGERCNVAGSRKFLRLINEGNIDEAVEIAATQVEKGAQAVDINMDDGLLDSPACMKSFVTRLQVEPRVARVPMVIDSSDWNTILAGLKCVQGKPLVNSISLKEGEDKFLAHAREINRLGAAMVVMAFDENGQATTLQRRLEICRRAYKLLTEKGGIDPADIVFDPNILTIATGISDHDKYAIDFIETVREIKHTLPYAKTGGGVSNLSFAFRGNNYLREAMHAVFLYHAVKAGLDTAIVNAAALIPVDDIDAELRDAIEDVIFNRKPDAVERLTEFATRLKQETPTESQQEKTTVTLSPAEQLKQLIIKGSTSGLETVLNDVIPHFPKAVEIIDGPLMEAMDKVGEMFGDGRMFLPQVVKSAAVMKEAVAILQPRLDAELTAGEGYSAGDRHRIVLATVKGDVHDIGKNIVGIIMKCNGWDVIDLGVMVPPDRIVKAAIDNHTDAIGLSGLITPSLEEMRRTASLLRENGVNIPLFIGGATTSALHTALKIAPEYDGLTVHTRDAASMPGIAARLASAATFENEKERILNEQLRLREETTPTGSDNRFSLEDARKAAHKYVQFSNPAHRPDVGKNDIEFSPSQLSEIINRKALLAAWNLDPATPEHPEAKKLLDDADAMINYLEASGYRIKARAITLPAKVDNRDTLIVKDLTIPLLRQQKEMPDGTTLCISDFINPDGSDIVTLFTVTAPPDVPDTKNEYEKLLLDSLLHRLAEAGTELLHRQLSGGEKIGIRPAVGYPMLPDQSLMNILDKELKYGELNIDLTENGALHPSATTSGLIIYNPAARYFEIGKIGNDQLEDYSARRGIPAESLRPFLAYVL